MHYRGSVGASHSPGATGQYVYIIVKFAAPPGALAAHSMSGTTFAFVEDDWNPNYGEHAYAANARTYASVTYN